MEKFTNFDSFLDKDLRIVSQCPICQADYKSLKLKVLEEKDYAHLVFVECSKCHSSVIALVFLGQTGITSVGLLTDLKEKDLQRLKSSSAIKLDEVLDLHCCLKEKKFIQQLLAK